MNEQNEKTFTQSEVNGIISERLKQERARLSRELAEREAALDRRETLIEAKSDWTKRGLPANLLDSVDLDKPGALEAAEQVLLEMNRSGRGGYHGHQDIIGSSDINPDDAIRKAFDLNRKKD